MSDTAVSSPTETSGADNGRFTEAFVPSHGGGLIRSWKKGQSGNPGAKSGAYLEAVRICREASPRAARRLVELMEDKSDTRVAFMAARECMNRGIGTVKEAPPAEPHTLDLTKLDDAQQRVLLQMLKMAMGV